MPKYGYRCQSCQCEFEVLQRMSDPPQAACPECGGGGTRLFYPTGILFKGSGFYKTDSRSSTAASATSDTDGAKPAQPAKSSEAAKPAAPSADKPSAPAKPGGAATTMKPAPTAE
jgi:putative FmdB family regulatory protein